jgi:hypothetical protein
LLKSRSTNLKASIQGLLDDQHLADDSKFLEAFYGHSLITGLTRDGGHPSYIPSRTFATVLIDLATHQVEGSLQFDQLQSGIKALPTGAVRTALLALVQNAAGNFDRAQGNIERWYDDAMERASGWYKRRTQVWTIGLAVAITLAVNADTLEMAKRLWTDPAVRAVAVEHAKGQAEKFTARDLGTASAIIGWTTIGLPAGPVDWLERLAGWLLTVIAISLGAPFWFDLLNRFMNLRSSGKRPEETGRVVETAKLTIG